MGKWGKLLILAVLSGITYLSLSNFNRFTLAGGQLAVDPLFINLPRQWREKGSGEVLFSEGSAIIRSSNGGVMVYQTIPIDASGYYRLSFDARAEHISFSADAGSWAGAGVLLRYVKDKGIRKYGAPIKVPSDVAVHKTFQVDKHVRGDVRGLDVVMWIHEANGLFSVKNLSLNRLKETRSYTLLKWMIGVVWICVCIWLVITAFSLFPTLYFIGITSLCTVALIGALMPEAVLNIIFHNISNFLPQIIPLPVVETTHASPVADKGQVEFVEIFSVIGHFLIFAGIGFIAGLNGRKFGFLFLLASSIIFALITEVLQLFIARRTASLYDLVVDATGVLLGLTLGIACLQLYEKTVVIKRT